MSKIHIKEESPTVRVEFEGRGRRRLGQIGHPVEGNIDWEKTVATCRMAPNGKGLEIELIPE